MSWTDERVTLLKKLWGEGKTAAEIARELGGVTRNAVIGKAHRLNLSNRVSPIQQNKKPQKQNPPQDAAAIQKSSEKPAKKAPTKPLDEKDNGRRVPLADLKGGMCRWPLGDPQEDNFGFCGDESVAGLPYCAEHSHRAYQAATRNRILQAEDLEKSLAAEEQKQALRKAAGQ